MLNRTLYEKKETLVLLLIVDPIARNVNKQVLLCSCQSWWWFIGVHLIYTYIYIHATTLSSDILQFRQTDQSPLNVKQLFIIFQIVVGRWRDERIRIGIFSYVLITLISNVNRFCRFAVNFFMTHAVARNIVGASDAAVIDFFMLIVVYAYDFYSIISDGN